LSVYTRLQPILYVRDLATEKEFYRKLGFSVAYEKDDFAAMSYRDTILFGLQVKEGSNAASFEQQLIWQIGVQSVEAVCKLCEQEGLSIGEGPVLQDWGEWTVTVRSPNGYRVVFEGPLR